jgi:hypothetical protein
LFRVQGQGSARWRRSWGQECRLPATTRVAQVACSMRHVRKGMIGLRAQDLHTHTHTHTQTYRNYYKYSDHKLQMGPSEPSSRSSRVPKVCGRASEVWSGARNARLTLGTRARASRLDALRVPNKLSLQNLEYPKSWGQVGGRVSAGMSERASAMNAHKQ